MKRLRLDTINAHLRERDTAANASHKTGSTQPFDAWVEARQAPARLEFPSGEIMNPTIAGYVWAWNVMGRLTLGLPLTAGDNLSAQGLEGKVAVTTDLVVALNVWESLPAHRCNIYV